MDPASQRAEGVKETFQTLPPVSRLFQVLGMKNASFAARVKVINHADKVCLSLKAGHYWRLAFC
jgi:hypothetical protein